jgi:hypothetical protein
MIEDLHFSPIATFSGLRGVPLVALSRNSLYPDLVVGSDSVTIRVIRRHRLLFSHIREVAVRWRLAHQLTFVPRRGLRTFSANFISKTETLRAVTALQQRGVALDAATAGFVRAEAAPP